MSTSVKIRQPHFKLRSIASGFHPGILQPSFVLHSSSSSSEQPHFPTSLAHWASGSAGDAAIFGVREFLPGVSEPNLSHFRESRDKEALECWLRNRVHQVFQKRVDKLGAWGIFTLPAMPLAPIANSGSTPLKRQNKCEQGMGSLHTRHFKSAFVKSVKM